LFGVVVNDKNLSNRHAQSYPRFILTCKTVGLEFSS
jgi:hypothetical protein